MKDRRSGSPAGGSPKSGGKNPPKGQAAVGAAPKDAPGASRRRVILGGAAVAPVIVTLASRPALANVCTVSGTLSGNMSRPDAADCRGLTPGYWKTHPNQWPRYVPGPCNPLSNQHGHGTCNDYSVPSMDDLADAVVAGALTQAAVDAYLLAPHGTLFSAVFGSGLTNDPSVTLMQALWLDDTPMGGGSAPVLAHSVAALHNSVHFGATQFGYAEAEIVHMVAPMISSGDAAQLLADLELLNSRG